MSQMFQYLATLILWAVSVVLWVHFDFPYLALILLILHALEWAIIGYRVGRAFGMRAGRSFIMTILFGVFWWLPMHRQIKAETFTDADFIREE